MWQRRSGWKTAVSDKPPIVKCPRPHRPRCRAGDCTRCDGNRAYHARYYRGNKDKWPQMDYARLTNAEKQVLRDRANADYAKYTPDKKAAKNARERQRFAQITHEQRQRHNARVQAHRRKHPTGAKPRGQKSLEHRLYMMNHNSARRGAIGEVTLEEWKFILSCYDSCPYCNQAFVKGNWTFEHIIPIRFGGSNYAHNVVPACEGCNSNRRAKELIHRQAMEKSLLINTHRNVIYRMLQSRATNLTT
jgi:5-methylcytosine-specific restriction endonuclease McrA